MCRYKSFELEFDESGAANQGEKAIAVVDAGFGKRRAVTSKLVDVLESMRNHDIELAHDEASAIDTRCSARQQ